MHVLLRLPGYIHDTMLFKVITTASSSLQKSNSLVTCPKVCSYVNYIIPNFLVMLLTSPKQNLPVRSEVFTQATVNTQYIVAVLIKNGNKVKATFHIFKTIAPMLY